MECLKPTNTMVKNLVHVQNSYINTYHPDFMGGANSIFSVFEPSDPKDSLKGSQTPLATEENEPVDLDGNGINYNDIKGHQTRQIGQEDGESTQGFSGEERIKNMQHYEVNKYM